MKVLFITQTFFPGHKGGTEVYLYSLCKSLIAKEINCKVLCTNYKTTEKIKTFYYDGITVEIVSESEDLNQAVRNIILKEDFTIVHIHTMGGRINNDFLGGLKSHNNMPVIFTPHLAENLCLNYGKLQYKNKKDCNGFVSVAKCQACLSHSNKFLSPFFKYKLPQLFIQKILPGFVSRKIFSPYHFLAKSMKRRVLIIKQNNISVIALADWYFNVIKLNQINNCTIIPQAVNNEFTRSENDASANTNNFNWIFIGRLSSEKGIENLIDVFAQNAKENEKLYLCVFLDERMSVYEKLVVEKISLYPNIVIQYNCSIKELHQILNNADCLVLPSMVCEMAPLVIQEAFACGKPVLVSNFIRYDVEKLKVGLHFNYSIPGDFNNKFSMMRHTSFPGLNNFEPLSFTEVAERHIDLYNKRLLN